MRMISSAKISGPWILLRLEGLAVLGTSCALYQRAGFPWGTFALLFFLPDILMAGYLWGNRFGANLYNCGHTYLVPLLLWGLGLGLARSGAVLGALIWIAHIGFDRFLGYGLKYPTAFKDTHLARV